MLFYHVVLLVRCHQCRVHRFKILAQQMLLVVLDKILFTEQKKR